MGYAPRTSEELEDVEKMAINSRNVSVYSRIVSFLLMFPRRFLRANDRLAMRQPSSFNYDSTSYSRDSSRLSDYEYHYYEPRLKYIFARLCIRTIGVEPDVGVMGKTLGKKY